jgi:hypothetical protein
VRLRFTDATFLAIALRTEPDTVPIAADPPFAVQIETAAIIDGLPFELIQEHVVMQCPIVNGMSLHIRECSFAILIGERRDEGRVILRRLVARTVLMFICRFRRRLLLDRFLLRVACVRVRSG